MNQVVYSPLQKIREERGLTRKELAELLHTRSYVITKIEGGNMRIPAAFYELLRTIGVDPFELAIQQENFIRWRREFYSRQRWGLPPQPFDYSY
jgi:transcriptional regulator with XRE-family HTH domain